MEISKQQMTGTKMSIVIVIIPFSINSNSIDKIKMKTNKINTM